MSGPRVTSVVLPRLLASLHAELLRGFNHGDIPASVHRAMSEEIETLATQRRRGRAPEDPELFCEWLGKRHASLPETREKRAVAAMLGRLSALVRAYAAGYEDGTREAKGEKRPTPLADELARSERAS